MPIVHDPCLATNLDRGRANGSGASVRPGTRMRRRSWDRSREAGSFVPGKRACRGGSASACGNTMPGSKRLPSAGVRRCAIVRASRLGGLGRARNGSLVGLGPSGRRRRGSCRDTYPPRHSRSNPRRGALRIGLVESSATATSRVVRSPVTRQQQGDGTARRGAAHCAPRTRGALHRCCVEWTAAVHWDRPNGATFVAESDAERRGTDSRGRLSGEDYAPSMTRCGPRRQLRRTPPSFSTVTIRPRWVRAVVVYGDRGESLDDLLAIRPFCVARGPATSAPPRSGACRHRGNPPKRRLAVPFR